MPIKVLGGAKMIGGAMVTTIMTLWERYKNKTLIAQMTGHDWKTVSKIVKNSGRHEKKPHPRILDPHKEQILQWLEEGLTNVRILEKLRENGVKVGKTTVRDFVIKLKGRENIFVRVETKPGEEAQVDFGYAGLTPDNNGKQRKTWVFCLRLSYSRLDYCEKVYNQRVETFIQCHINAFRYIGGVPEYIKIDNLKAAILEANFYAPVYQHLYKMFADHYGFKPLPCRVRQPNDKGKVESGVKYVKGNFFLGRKFNSSDDLDRQLRAWLDNTCNQRVHGTIRRIPREIFESEEKRMLKPLPSEEFKMAAVGSRKVYHDCHIYVEYNYYSVPFEYVGKEVDIELARHLLKIFYQGQEIAVHPRQEGRGKFCTNISHYPQYKRCSETEYQEKYQTKMAEVGPYAEQLFFLILQNRPRDWSGTVRGILSLLKNYPAEIVELACRRALAFGVDQYQIIRNICKNGSYNLPSEFNFTKEDDHANTQIQTAQV
jgi:transposase